MSIARWIAAVWLLVLVSAALTLTGAGAASAEEAHDEFFGVPVPDLTVRQADHPDNWIRPNVRIDTVFFVESNPWAGEERAILGKNSSGWNETGVVPGIDAHLSLGDFGALSGRLSGVFTTTQIGMDAAGSNLDSDGVFFPKSFTLEDFYVRWTSGELLPSLGTDAIDISVGAQPYQLGPAAEDNLGAGFLMYNGGSDGGNRGGYWLGLRNAFRMAGIARLKMGHLTAEAVYLTPNDDPHTATDVTGMTLAYDFGELLGRDFAKLTAGYFNIFHSDNARRDGLNAVDVGVDVAPLHVLPGLRFTGEMVKENNGAQNDSWGAWGELGYDFAANKVRYAPYASYRIAYFTGDDQTGDNNAFDPLFYGFSDWNYWYVGEIVGEWIAGNSNTTDYTLRLRANPCEPVTTQLFWTYYRLNDAQSTIPPPGGRPPSNPLVGNITDKNLAHELDFTLDWQVNDHLLLSTVGAVLVPLKGGEQFFGSDRVWGQWMVYASTKF